MTKRTILFLLLIFSLTFYFQANAQIITSLPRSIPENEGVSSKAILDFVEAADKSKHEFHSFMLLRHGKVIAEGWWNPYKPELKHTMYSVSKSFTSTAIGFAVSEKLLTVNDKVISFFPDDLPDSISPYLKELSVKNLLSMSAGQDPDPTSLIRNWNTNWIKSFLAVPIIDKPGSKFLYNSVATFMLSAIIQKITGQKLIDYLKPRLFDPLEIEGMDWEINPMDINTGGWGLRVKTEDLAKFGQFYLQKGNWNGKQLLPKEWIEEATTSKILQSPEVAQEKRDLSDWLQGYGYKFWQCRFGAFRGDGAFGQYIIMLPDQDAVVAITAESFDLQDELNLVWKYLLPAFQKEKLPVDEAEQNKLKKKLLTLALPVPTAKTYQHAIEPAQGKTFQFEKNTSQWESIAFQFSENECSTTIKADSNTYKLKFGFGSWVLGETERRGPNLIGDAKASFMGLPPSKIVGCYIWKDETTLELTLRYIESPHSEKITCKFVNKNADLEIKSSINPKSLILRARQQFE
ncbi:MAG: hypothetical protein FD122_2612 [Stygiobacter sp.]|nr:MAG: hypothetical protein FD122_2612 [Stygiobacter sp.]KAF0212602.1 MAG: hypothetical protein FD178_3116 [Ignavibacteria bacterium]